MKRKAPTISPDAKRPKPLRAIKRTAAEIEESKRINEAISLFEELLPGEFISGAAYKKTTTRQAVGGMLKDYSIPELTKLIKDYGRRRLEQYAPSIGTIHEFCTYKRAKIEGFLHKKDAGLKSFHGEDEGQTVENWQLGILGDK